MSEEAGRILRATLLSLALALVTLFSVVLPAEYGWDPLGIGEALGLKGFSETPANPLRYQDGDWVTDYIQFTLSPFEAVEYKYRLEAGQVLQFSWRASGEVVYEMHAEPDGAADGYADTFSKSRGDIEQGSYTAGYEGIHGWFWQNRGEQEVTVTLRAQGFLSTATEYRDGDSFVYALTEGQSTPQP